VGAVGSLNDIFSKGDHRMGRNRFVIFIILLLVVLFSSSLSQADTNVSGRIASDTTWTLANSPYIVTSTVQIYGTTTAPVTLTIEPGVVVKFNSGMGLQIGYGTSQGALIARGTEDNRITFTCNAATGAWGAINFQDGTVDSVTVLENLDAQYSTGVSMTSASPVIKNSTIMANGTSGISLTSSSPVITGGSLTNSYATGHGIYGSGSPVISNYTVTIVNSVGKYGFYSTGTAPTLSITNSTIANGLYIASTNITPVITGNTFTNNDNSPLRAGANIVGQILASNTFTEMTGAGRIEVLGEQVKQDALWKKWPAPYVVVIGTVEVHKDTTTPSTLTIDPGVTVRFASSSGLQIGSSISTSTSQGALIARGTPEDRITFTRNAISGIWGKISFYDGTVDSSTIVEHADIQYNSGISMVKASPVIKDSVLADVWTHGFDLNTSHPLLQNITITSASSYGMNLSSSNPTVENVSITSSGLYGIFLSNSSPVITGGGLTNINSAGDGISGNGSPVISNYSIAITNSPGKYGVKLSPTTSSLSIINSTIANGLSIGSLGIAPTITGNSFTNFDNSPLKAGASIVGRILNDNTFTGMTWNL
jgi:hypothetical protein